MLLGLATNGKREIPLETSGIKLWLDASDSSTIVSSGSTVTTWRDKSGLGNNAIQLGSTTLPTTGINTANGRNVVTFGGAATMQIGASGTPGLGVTGIPSADNTSFIVVRSNQDLATQTILWMGIAGVPGTIRYFHKFSSNSGLVTFNNATTNVAVTASGVTKSNLNILTSSLSLPTQSISLNNGAAVTNASGVYSADSNLASLGALNGTTQFLNGDIAEIIMYNRALSSTEISNINKFLSAKWGIAVS